MQSYTGPCTRVRTYGLMSLSVCVWSLHPSAVPTFSVASSELLSFLGESIVGDVRDKGLCLVSLGLEEPGHFTSRT